MSMVSEILTYDESRILNMYARKPREEVIENIEFVLPYIPDTEMKDNCKSLLNKLRALSNKDYDELDV